MTTSPFFTPVKSFSPDFSSMKFTPISARRCGQRGSRSGEHVPYRMQSQAELERVRTMHA